MSVQLRHYFRLLSSTTMKSCRSNKLLANNFIIDFNGFYRNMSTVAEVVRPTDPNLPVEIMDVEEYRRMNGIECFGNSVADPIKTFDTYRWHPNLYRRIKEIGYQTTTPIQAQSLPIVFDKRDIVGIASSGSGKTLSFVLPALMRCMTSKQDLWPRCLILTPSRELTHQIEKVIKSFRFVRSICLYGGVSYEVQEMLLNKANPHIVISTPSRLETIFQKGITKLDNVDYVVVDEADLMLKSGQQSSFAHIMNNLPKKRQTLMFSATWPPSVQKLAEQYLDNYIRVNVSQTQSLSSLTVNKNIEQIVKVVKESEKEDKLLEVMNELVPSVTGFIKTIIFVRSKRTANRLVKFLKKESFPARAFHSSKHQEERDYIIREFRKGVIPILVATDVASRGLDFINVKFVINYDFPSQMEDYIHRIGRTGRYKETGKALTFFTAKNIYHKSNLIELLKETKQTIDKNLIDLTEESEDNIIKDDNNNNNDKDSGYESSGEGNDLDNDEDESSSSEWTSDDESTNKTKKL
ncbi:uncharacterized protein LOC128955973 [Oppia nitens]|uniref:uncharacterized protein LOC128955973 n=1 Tax=Oppia nitens TaxID=1686743 RepID=UPI0023DA35B2|nr:uncharacterized protein LOC128955973 [Oppia nitens]